MAADPADIIWAEGVTAGTSASSLSAAGEGTTYHIELLSAGAGDLRADPMASHTFGQDFHFELGKGAVKGESTTNLGALGSGAGAQALEESNFVYDKIPSIEDFGGSTEPWTQDLTVTDKYSGGYKITGDINLNAITVTAGVEYKKFWGVPYGIESAKVQVDSDIGATLRLEGNFSEEITIATIPIPLGPTGLSVSIDLSLYVNASGELEVRATLHSQTGFEYNGKGLVKSPSTSSAEAAAEMAVEVDFGARLAASLDALGVVKLADVRADLGGTLTADAYVGGTCDVVEDGGVTTLHYKQSMELGADLYVPIISISVGGDDSLIGMIGLSKTWDIMTKDNAQHFELMDYEWVFWEATVTVGEDGEILSAEEKEGDGASGEIEEAEPSPGASDPDRLDLTSYALTLSDRGEQLELDLQEGEAPPAVIWTSSDPSVAAVSDDGYVMPVGEGTAVITAALQSDPSIQVSCAVFVQTTQENDWQFLPDVV